MSTQIVKYKRCEECGGVGEVNIMESVYPGEPHMAPIGSEKCFNCNGSGKEPNEDIIIERIVENLDIDQENKLQEYFVGLGEVGGIPIIKDNCEDMFENWLGSVSLEVLEKVLYGNESKI